MRLPVALFVASLVLAAAGCDDRRKPANSTDGLLAWRPQQASGTDDALSGGSLDLIAIETLDDPERVVTTRFGEIRVQPDTSRPDRHVFAVAGAPAGSVQADRVVLSQRLYYADRDVVVGFANCADDAPICDALRPVWLVLQTGHEPRLVQDPHVFGTSPRTRVSADARGVHVELGLWDGVSRRATLDASSRLRVATVDEPPRPASVAACGVVSSALEDCARSRECASFDGASAQVPLERRRALSRLVHSTTGIDASQFMQFCVTSCRLALTPSRALIERDVCGGAAARQWARTDLGWVTQAVYERSPPASATLAGSNTPTRSPP